jgi:hypothetical protein
MKRFAYIALCFSLCMITSGCVVAALGVGAGAGVGTYSYLERELRVTYKAPLTEVLPKTLQALQDLKLSIESQQIDGLGGRSRHSGLTANQSR